MPREGWERVGEPRPVFEGRRDERSDGDIACWERGLFGEEGRGS
jgi:hypothetical protein